METAVTSTADGWNEDIVLFWRLRAEWSGCCVDENYVCS